MSKDIDDLRFYMIWSRKHKLYIKGRKMYSSRAHALNAIRKVGGHSDLRLHVFQVEETPKEIVSLESEVLRDKPLAIVSDDGDRVDTFQCPQDTGEAKNCISNSGGCLCYGGLDGDYIKCHSLISI